MKHIERWLFWATIFFIPSNLFLRLNEQNTYVRGIFVDYLIPKVYFSELVALAFICVSVINNFQKIKELVLLPKWRSSLVILTLFFLLQFILKPELLTATYLLQLGTTIALGVALLATTQLVRHPFTKYALISMLSFQSLLAIYQFLLQKSLGGFLLLGEPDLSLPLGLVHQQIFGSEQLLPFGTTAHPNILAGVLSLGLAITTLYARKQQSVAFRYLLYSAYFLVCCALYLTQSFTALFSLLIWVTAVLSPWKKISIRNFFIISTIFLLLIPLLLTKVDLLLPKDSSIYRRVVLNIAAVQMILKQPISGVGLLGFTQNLPEYNISREVIQFIQPAHHTPLLWLAETGVIGLAIIMYVLYQLTKKRKVIPIILLAPLPIMTLDHYLLTQQTGLLLLVIFVVFSDELTDS